MFQPDAFQRSRGQPPGRRYFGGGNNFGRDLRDDEDRDAWGGGISRGWARSNPRDEYDYRGGGDYRGGYRGGRGGYGGGYRRRGYGRDRGRDDDDDDDDDGWGDGGWRYSRQKRRNDYWRDDGEEFWDRGGYRGRGRGYARNYYQHDDRDNCRGRGGAYQRGRPRNYDGPRRRWQKTATSRVPAGAAKDVCLLTTLPGHAKAVTAVAFDEGSGRLFTASKDGTVRLWSADSGECQSTVKIGGEVDVLLLASRFLFIGMHGPDSSKGGDVGSVRVFNLASNSEQSIVAHEGPVLCLHGVDEFLFSGGQDCDIKAFKYNTQTLLFESVGVLSRAQNGHSAPVTAMTSIPPTYLFSGDRQGNIKVWSLDVGSCSQTLERAHCKAIMSMIVWQGVLISGALDGAIKVWTQRKASNTGLVLDTAPNYEHQRQGAFGGEAPGVLSMCGTPDGKKKAVLMVGRTNGLVALYDLPEFRERGILPEIHQPRALGTGPSGLMFTGDKGGRGVKIWQWDGDWDDEPQDGNGQTGMADAPIVL